MTRHRHELGRHDHRGDAGNGLNGVTSGGVTLKLRCTGISVAVIWSRSTPRSMTCATSAEGDIDDTLNTAARA
jgi:hypothetical protein